MEAVYRDICPLIFSLSPPNKMLSIEGLLRLNSVAVGALVSVLSNKWYGVRV